MKLLFLILFTSLSVHAGKLMDADHATEAQLVSAGATKASLLNDTKIYISSGSINKTLDDAITDGDIGGGAELTVKGNLLGFGSATEECVLDKTNGKILTVDSTATCGFEMKDAPVSTTLSIAGQLQGFSTVNAAVDAPTASNLFLTSDLNEATKMKWSESVLGQISQAHKVGSIRWIPTTNCRWQQLASGTGSYPVDAQCDDNARVVVGDIADVGGTQPNFNILNARTDGYYKVVVSGAIYTIANNCSHRLRYAGTTSNLIETNSNTINIKFPHLTFDFKFSSTGTKLIELLVNSGASGACYLDARTADLKFDVYFMPETNPLVSMQERVIGSMHAAGGSSISITAAATNIPFTALHDPENAWDGDEYTVQEDGNFLATGSFRTATDINPLISFYIDGVEKGFIGLSLSGTFHTFSGQIRAEAGDKISIRINKSTTMTAAQPTNNHITISEIVDKTALVALAPKCQTKYLSTNVSATSLDNADLRFTGLTIGVKYIAYITGHFAHSNNSGDSRAMMRTKNNGVIIKDNWFRDADNNAGTSKTTTLYFTAAGTSLNTDLNNFNGGFMTITGDGSNDTNIRLCTDVSQETTEW